MNNAAVRPHLYNHINDVICFISESIPRFFKIP